MSACIVCLLHHVLVWSCCHQRNPRPARPAGCLREHMICAAVSLLCSPDYASFMAAPLWH